METHVKVLAALHLAGAAIGLLGAVILMVVFGGAAGIVGASAEPNAAFALPIIGLTGIALIVFSIIASLPAATVGIGLWQRRAWGRIGGIVLSILELMMIPFGTILGIYGLWVLFSKDTERLFNQTQPENVVL
jgi:hypothetical protein